MDPSELFVNDNAFKFDSLKAAAKLCAKGVRWKKTTMDYLNSINRRTDVLTSRFENSEYTTNTYNHFIITEPKLRHISSSTFTDRVVQRSLCKDAVYDNLTRCLVYDNAACQTHKGTKFATDRLMVHLHRHFMHYGTEGFVLRIDIRKFFDNISHGLIKRIITENVVNLSYKDVLYDVVDSFNDPVILSSFRRENAGIPLGSQLSQLFALNALNQVDHFIQESLRIHTYIRYMDDLVIIFPNDYQTLKLLTKLIVGRIECLGFEVNHKAKITPLGDGVKLMHQKFVLTKTGRIIRSVDRKLFRRERRKLGKMFKCLYDKKYKDINLGIILRHYQGWRATMIAKVGRYAVQEMDSLFDLFMSQRRSGAEIRLEYLDGLDKDFIKRFCMNHMINTDSRPQISLFK